MMKRIVCALVLTAAASLPALAKNCPDAVPAGVYGQPAPASFLVVVSEERTFFYGNGVCNSGEIPGPLMLEKIRGHCHFELVGIYRTCSAHPVGEGEQCHTEQVRYVGTYDPTKGTLSFVIVHEDGRIDGPYVTTEGVQNDPPLC